MRAILVLVHGRGGTENLVLGGHSLQISSEALILIGGFLLGGFEACEFGLEVLDMLFFAFAECSLTASKKNKVSQCLSGKDRRNK